jgi:hypothetical protein
MRITSFPFPRLPTRLLAPRLRGFFSASARMRVIKQSQDNDLKFCAGDSIAFFSAATRPRKSSFIPESTLSLNHKRDQYLFVHLHFLRASFLGISTSHLCLSLLLPPASHHNNFYCPISWMAKSQLGKLKIIN